MKHTFTLEYWQDAGWYVGKLREIPGVFSQGETIKELEENIGDAYQLLMAEAAKFSIRLLEREIYQWKSGEYTMVAKYAMRILQRRHK